MRVVQCWDDGVTTDIPLIEILRRHQAKATFNLNTSVYQQERSYLTTFKGTEVLRLAMSELRGVYEGFTIGNHTVSHPSLPTLPDAEARREIVDGRDFLQQHFQQPVDGFAYPIGHYDARIMELVREAGHAYARTIVPTDVAFPPADPMAFHPHCHFLAEDFDTKYEAAKTSGVFYFWGHSFELLDDAMWTDFERRISRIAADPESEWAELTDLFAAIH
ncbi:polysaccharide deacetylase family protein [Cerasicoccus maritimus]|uniref:polysaccharide deacetylase family protein n=1 Tax=Cerasicoccus maritimus TaxID=490089 RepID=UPI0028526646|nr:polysaccharide deacetylase family protein [Cerasicoccus maritimus]